VSKFCRVFPVQAAAPVGKIMDSKIIFRPIHGVPLVGRASFAPPRKPPPCQPPSKPAAGSATRIFSPPPLPALPNPTLSADQPY
jgi:hypothetical protein